MNKIMKTLGAIAAMAMLPTASFAQIFMDAGIEGNSTQLPYEGQIVLNSFDFGVGAAEGKKVGTCEYNDISVSKTIDMATADLIQAAALGTQLGDVIITVTRPNSDGTTVPAIEFTLMDTVVARYDTSASSGNTTEEILTLRFSDVMGRVGNQNFQGVVTFEPFDVSCF